MLIFGIAGYAKVLGQMMALCGRCHNQAVHHVVKRGSKFSLFFIPLIPLSGRYQLECSICGQGRQLSRQEAESLAAGEGAYAQQPPVQQQGQQQFPQYPQGQQQPNPWADPNQR